MPRRARAASAMIPARADPRALYRARRQNRLRVRYRWPEHAFGNCSIKFRRDPAWCRSSAVLPRKLRLHRPDFDHVRDEMAQQVLDPVIQGRGRGRAARAGPLHVEIHDAFLVTTEGYVAAVSGDGRTHARLDQILDSG